VAKTNGPLFSSEARGGVGGIVHNTYRGLHTVKAKTAPHQSSSPKALLQRSIAVTLARAWADCQYKAEWNAYANEHPTSSFAGAIRPSGANCYVALNTQILRFALSEKIDRPPTAPSPSPVEGFSLDQLAFGPIIRWVKPNGPNDYVDIWLQGPRSTGRIPDLNLAVFRAIRPASTLAYKVFDLTIGQYTFFIRQCNPATGQVSEFLSADIYVTRED
jgi:hypothetical protein